MSNTTPVPPPAQSPANPAAQTTPAPKPGPGKKQASAGQAAPTTVFPTAVPAPAAQPAPTPVPKPKRKPLPQWAWSVIGGVVAAILYWVARDIMLPVIIVAMGAVIGPKVHTTISSWKQERERKAALAAAAAGQPTTPTTQFTATFGSRWRFGVRVVVTLLFASLGAVIGSIVIWQVAALIMKSTDFLWEGWMTYALAVILGSLMAIIFGALGNKLATKLL